MTVADAHRAYAAVDEEQLDDALGAVALAGCMQSGLCVPGTRSFDPGATATRMQLAQRVEPAEARVALSAGGQPRVCVDRIVAEVGRARRTIRAALHRMPKRERALYLMPISRARKQWQQDRALLAGEYEAWERLRGEADRAFDTLRVGPSLLDRLRQVRRAYIAACVDQGRRQLDCAGMRVARQTSYYIVRVAALTDDLLTVRAEVELMAAIPDRSRLSYTIHHDVGRVLREQQVLFGKRPNRAGVKPPRAPAEIVAIYRRAAERRRDERVEKAVVVVDRIRRRGQVATVYADGKPPVTVPRDDASALRTGDRVRLLYVSTPGDQPRPGRVLAAARADEGHLTLVQVGAYSL
jgi:hypothetical protein